mmetsp:Transcript_26342/g.57720  ORF Transcript_26342/g.57720 Transcript_26342/m.57720 type:complete len:80 (-) Transcript_26342:263-502(-)
MPSTMIGCYRSIAVPTSKRDNVASDTPTKKEKWSFDKKNEQNRACSNRPKSHPIVGNIRKTMIYLKFVSMGLESVNGIA